MTNAAKSPPKKDSPLAELPFSYPFRKPGEKEFTDEHEFHKLLADESTGFFPISDSGMWHGGIHVSAAGAGKQLDLKYGVRCIAKGDVVAYRVDSVYPVSEPPAQDGLPTVKAPYSTGFALVRHSMEYPRGQKLTFFSLYMHLQSVEEYEKDSTLKKPVYWDLAYEILDSAVDRPEANANTGIAAPEGQVGLRVRAAPRRGQILAILPQGARLRIGEKKEKDLWGKIVEIESDGDMYPPQAGAYVADDAKTGWIFLGEEHGKPVVKQVLSDTQLDRVVVLPKPFPINAGDLIGHLGQYDLLSPPTAGNRMVHIEVLCDEEVESYLKQSRTYVDQHAKDEDHTIVRVDKQVKLYKKMGQEGVSAPETGVVQIYPVSVLAAGKKEDQAQETVAGSDGLKAHWWMIDSADVRHAPIEGWVRETNHAGGRVTLEAPHQWVDFKTLEEAHDPTHTMFASAQGWIDYKLDAPVPDVAALAKLSPAANEIYRAAYPTGSGAQAADELRKASKDKWRQLILSRLIVRHESEWANPAKWDSLFAQVEERTAHDPSLDEEKKRIAKLVWWSDVAEGKIEGFPSSPDVFHIHPIGLLGNFGSRSCICVSDLTADQLHRIATSASEQLINRYVDALNGAFNDYKISSCVARAHFLAQLLHESGEMQFTRELGAKKEYDPWRGRGLIQLTHETNYRAYQAYSGEDFTSNVVAMAKLEVSPHAVLSAAWFFCINSNLLGASVDDDFIWITRIVNGGFNNYDDRLRYLNRAIGVFDAKSCLKLNQDGIYKFEKSRAFNEKRASFAWGLWNDPGLQKIGKTKHKAESLAGYSRYIELDDQKKLSTGSKGGSKDTGWYGIGKNTDVREYALTRTKQLNITSG
jgi:predicted chitinase